MQNLRGNASENEKRNKMVHYCKQVKINNIRELDVRINGK